MHIGRGWSIEYDDAENALTLLMFLFCSFSGGGPFTYSSQQETVVHDLPTDDKDYISVAEEVS